jgi:hypothetical protein
MEFSEMKRLSLSLASACVIVLSACSTLRVGEDFDHQASFTRYQSYNLMEREHHGTANPLVVQRARDAIEAELKRKGFAAAATAEQADLIVDFTIGSRDRTDIESFPSSSVAYGWWDARGWWEPYWGNGVDVRTYKEGTLSIDVFDSHTHRPLWHGWAKKELTRSDLEHSEAPIQTAVAAVLKKFPPR